MRHLLSKKNYVSKTSLVAVAAVLTVALTPLPHTASAAGSVVGELQSGESLNRGETITSQNGQFKLKLQADGNLVQYNGANKAVWALGVIDSTANKLTMQGDGNLVLYSQTKGAIWSSGSAGTTGEKLVVQNDGNLVNYASFDGDTYINWEKAWVSNLYLYESLAKDGGVMSSVTGKYRMRLQGDGNLVIYTEYGKAVWSAKPQNSTAEALILHSNGNAAIYASKGAAWQTNTGGKPIIDRLTLQDDGNLVLYNEKGQAVWRR